MRQQLEAGTVHLPGPLNVLCGVWGDQGSSEAQRAVANESLDAP